MEDSYMEHLNKYELLQLEMQKQEIEEHSMEELYKIIENMDEDWFGTNTIKYLDGEVSEASVSFKRILTDNLMKYCESKEQYERLSYLQKLQ